MAVMLTHFWLYQFLLILVQTVQMKGLQGSGELWAGGVQTWFLSIVNSIFRWNGGRHQEVYSRNVGFVYCARLLLQNERENVHSIDWHFYYSLFGRPSECGMRNVCSISHPTLCYTDTLYTYSVPSIELFKRKKRETNGSKSCCYSNFILRFTWNVVKNVGSEIKKIAKLFYIWQLGK